MDATDATDATVNEFSVLSSRFLHGLVLVDGVAAGSCWWLVAAGQAAFHAQQTAAEHRGKVHVACQELCHGWHQFEPPPAQNSKFRGLISVDVFDLVMG